MSQLHAGIAESAWRAVLLGLLGGCIVAACADAAVDPRAPDARPPSCVSEPSFFNQPEITRLPYGDALRVSLDAFCEAMGDSCTHSAPTSWPIRVMGCGVESFQSRQGNFAARQWNYDTETGELVGAGLHDDVAHQIAGCVGARLQAGQGPPLGPEIDGGATDPPSHRTICQDIVVTSDDGP